MKIKLLAMDVDGTLTDGRIYIGSAGEMMKAFDVKDKLLKLKEVAERYGCTQDEIAYIGDDLNDLECIQYCGITACPADAVTEVKAAVRYVCRNEGGRGAVREFVQRIIRT